MKSAERIVLENDVFKQIFESKFILLKNSEKLSVQASI